MGSLHAFRTQVIPSGPLIMTSVSPIPIQPGHLASAAFKDKVT